MLRTLSSAERRNCPRIRVRSTVALVKADHRIRLQIVSLAKPFTALLQLPPADSL